MEEITNIEQFNEEIEKCETWGEARSFFERVGLEMLKNFLDVSRSAQEFKLLTLRGDFMANQAQYEYQKRTGTQPSFI